MAYLLWIALGAALGALLGMVSGELGALVVLGGALGLMSAVSFRKRHS